MAKTRLKGLYGALGLIILFTIYVYVAGIVFFRPNTHCYCGGVITLLSWPQHLMFNIELNLLAISGMRLYRKRKFPDTLQSQYQLEQIKVQYSSLNLPHVGTYIPETSLSIMIPNKFINSPMLSKKNRTKNFYLPCPVL